MLTRRELLTTLVSAGSLSAFAGVTPRWLVQLGQEIHEQSGARALNAHQRRIVELAAERIIPRTDTPGATDARVADFVDVIVSDWYSPAERDRFLAGLADLDARAARSHGGPFSATTEQQQIALLTVIDGEVAALRQTSGRAADEHWFGMLKYLTVWGYYTSRVGMIDELKVELHAGRYDGDAPYLEKAEGKRQNGPSSAFRLPSS